ncbi:MAG: murein biosynthesis integral membrane protein MurJ [Opitutaceae bacterium]
MSKNLRSIGTVSGATVLSRVLGLARDMLTTAVFGASALNSAFVTAFTLPNLFRRLLGEGALTAALVPTMSEELEACGREAAFALVNKVASWLLVVTSGLVALAVAAMGAVHLFEGLEPRWHLCAHLGQILFPYVVAICLAAVFGAALNLLDEYLVPAMSAVWLNLCIILSLGAGAHFFGETPMEKMYWLCGGTLAGGFLQFATPARALWRRGWRPRFDLAPSDRFRELLLLMGPGVFGAAIFQINILTSRGLAFALNESAATLLYLANRLMEVPLGIFTIAVSTVTFPLIARCAARGERREMAAHYHRAILLTMHIALPASVGLFLLAEPVVRMLFQRGEFGGADTAAMTPVLGIFCVGLPFYSYVTLVTRAFHALKDTRTPVRVAAGAFVLNLALSLALMRPYGVLGLAAASNLAIAVQTIVLQAILGRRHPALAARAHLRGLGGVCAIAFVMGLVVRGGWFLLRQAGLAPVVEGLLAVCVLIPAGALAYFAAALLLRVDGLDEVRALVRRFARG